MEGIEIKWNMWTGEREQVDRNSQNLRRKGPPHKWENGGLKMAARHLSPYENLDDVLEVFTTWGC
jgi:hypothetical protein